MSGSWKLKAPSADTIQLTGIGYWHSIQDPTLPDPGAFVDEQWDPQEREYIVRYLKAGISMPYGAGGFSWCRFRCGILNVGSGEVTDGRYVWPEGLAHYVEKHNVRLPQEVIDFMLSDKKFVTVYDDWQTDWTWWFNQKGWNTSITTLTDPHDWGILSVVQTNKMQRLKQGDALRKHVLNLDGVSEKTKKIERVLQGEEVHLKGRFDHVDSILTDFSKAGLQAHFRRLTREEYEKDNTV